MMRRIPLLADRPIEAEAHRLACRLVNAAASARLPVALYTGEATRHPGVAVFRTEYAARLASDGIAGQWRALGLGPALEVDPMPIQDADRRAAWVVRLRVPDRGGLVVGDPEALGDVEPAEPEAVGAARCAIRDLLDAVADAGRVLDPERMTPGPVERAIVAVIVHGYRLAAALEVLGVDLDAEPDRFGWFRVGVRGGGL